MRVIAGKYRSRLLTAPRGLATRPTSDRRRETLFNILGDRVVGARFADLFAGAGAVGIEAISRGAEWVCFVERAAPALAAIRANLTSLKISSGCTVEPQAVASALDRFVSSGHEDLIPWDIVFLDPPWEAEGEYNSTLASLGRSGSRLLAANALVVAEHAARSSLKEKYGSLTRTRIHSQGDAALSFYIQETS